jgi:hypothetical protein
MKLQGFEMFLIIEGVNEKGLAIYIYAKINGRVSAINRALDGSTFPG